MRHLAAASVLALAVSVTGCSAGGSSTPPGRSVPTKSAAVPAGDPAPRVEALGDGWTKLPGRSEPVEVCAGPLLPSGPARGAALTDPDGRTVRIEFIEVRDASAAVGAVEQALSDCEIFDGPDAFFYAWATPSSQFGDGTIGYVLPVDHATGDPVAGGVGVAVAPATGGVVVAVSVYAAAGDDQTAETLERYADLVARNQVDANAGLTPDPVPAYETVETPVPAAPTDPLVPPVTVQSTAPSGDPDAG